ncbi:MAG TPA: transcription termination factor Rho [Pseudonocardiaceae bacterium]|jgi:transcription termination factor Rho|nr:transcription termination factor Rho [Pseudonocardiaceae bacterium]
MENDITGIVDVVGQHAFVRVDDYLPGPRDLHISQAVRHRYGLRRGDIVTGAAGKPGNGQKLAPLSEVHTVNGQAPNTDRPEFGDLVPVYPHQRLRLETEPHELTGRTIDLVMPVGKGQRAMIVAPPKTGKTSVLQAIAHGLTKNHPECQLIVVLVGERPEEVTDFARSVPGEVIAATFDQPPHEHTAIAELAIERAKRLVESGRDVVVLLDSLTRLGRAYNLAAPASGRILSGGIDAGALNPPKRFLGAARAVENGGSLTIFATALVDTGSVADNLIFEEFKATSNADLRLDRGIANQRTFPAIDIERSSTRHDEKLQSPEELATVRALRRVLAGRDTAHAADVLLGKLREIPTNEAFLTQLRRAS